jgi:PAS domain S-box-containing protein
VENRDVSPAATAACCDFATEPAVIQWDKEGRIIACSSAAESLLGIEARQAVGRGILQLLSQETPFIDEQARLALFGQGRACESISEIPSGPHGKTLLRWHHTPISDGSGRVTAAVSVGWPASPDNPAPKAAQAAPDELCMEKELMAAVLNNSSDGIAVGTRDGKLKFFSPALERLLGYTIEEVPDNETLMELLLADPAVKAQAPEMFRNDAASANPPERIFPVIRKSGERRWCRVKMSRINDDLRMVSVSDITERMEAAEVLRQNEERFRKIFEESPLGMVIVDKGFRLIKANAVVSRVLGYSKEELSSLTMEKVTHPDDLKGYLGYMEDLVSGRIPQYKTQKRYIGKDGRTIWASVTATPIHDESGNILYILIMVEDITERMEAEERLRKSEGIYRSFVQNLQGIAFQGRMDYTPDFFHGAVEAITGYMEQDFLAGKPRWDQLIHPDDVDSVRKSVEAFMSGPGSSCEREYRIVRKDGRVRWVREIVGKVCDHAGKTLFVRGTIHDITGRKRGEDELRASRERFKSIFDKAPASIVIVGPDHSLVDCNPCFLRMTGYGREEILGRDFIGTFIPPGQGDISAAHFKGIFAGELKENVERPVVAKDGSTRTISWTGALFIMENGQRAAMGIGVDITERMALEAQLRQAQKMEAVGRLAGGVAHEFNNLHCGILGYLDIALRREKIGKSLRAKLNRVYDAASRAAAVTRRLLAFSRRQKAVKEPARLDEVVLDTVRLMQADFKNNAITVATRLNAKARIVMDKGQIAQVVMNLLLNARDAMMDTKSRVLSITTALDRHRATLTVSDTGCGIAASELPRIFEPFYTTKGPLAARGEVRGARVSGTGLGLSVCYGIVKEHGGSIVVESEKGRGAKFIVTLPRIAGDDVARRTTPRRRHASQGGRIVLVNDDEMIHGILIEILGAEGYQAEGFSDVGEAVAAVKENPPDAVIVDAAGLGSKAGAVVGKLAALHRGKRPAILLMTEKAAVEPKRKTPGVSIISKPFTPSDILERLYTALHQKRRARKKSARRTPAAKPRGRKILRKGTGRKHEM